MGRREGLLVVLLREWLEATLATLAECWARRVESSRVRRFTCWFGVLEAGHWAERGKGSELLNGALCTYNCFLLFL